jgi:tRNA threonylcarbamoyladenosine biosynthesis protein TsaB
VNLLALETATSVCGVALLRDHILVDDRWIEERYVAAERIFGFIDDVLQNGRISPAELTGVAVSIGPGSFTGLRIGLSVAKGLHAATGMAIVPVPTLEALARAGAERARTEGAAMILAALDARRDEVYCQLFELDGDRLTPVWEVEDLSVAEVARRLPPRSIAVTGDAAGKVSRGPGGGEAPGGLPLIVLPAEFARCSAAAVGRLGDALFESGVRSDPATLEPRYVKEFFLRTKE